MDERDSNMLSSINAGINDLEEKIDRITLIGYFVAALLLIEVIRHW